LENNAAALIGAVCLGRVRPIVDWFLRRLTACDGLAVGDGLGGWLRENRTTGHDHDHDGETNTAHDLTF